MKPEDLLQPISGDSPTGKECVYDLEFQVITDMANLLMGRAELEEIKRQAQGPFSGENVASDQKMAQAALQSHEERVQMLGRQVKETSGKEVDVNRLPKLIEDMSSVMLRTHGKDLRVVLPFTAASTKSHGLLGLLRGLAVFEGMLRAFPDAVYPMDEDDPNDDSSRAMVFAELVSSTGMSAVLLETTLVSSRAGRIGFRDAEVLSGKLPPDPGGAGVTNEEHFLAVIKHEIAAHDATEPTRVSDEAVREKLRSIHTELIAAEETLRRINAGFKYKAHGSQRVLKLLESMSTLVGRLSNELAANEAMMHINRVASPSASISNADAQKNTVFNASQPMALNIKPSEQRELIRLQILELADALEKLEPSHPAPLFLKRAAKLLAAKSFFDIVTNMMPDSMSQVEMLTGHAHQDD